jgi:hypothetical protein
LGCEGDGLGCEGGGLDQVTGLGGEGGGLGADYMHMYVSTLIKVQNMF